MKQPNKFSIKKPRITLSEAQKNQARAGMAGEAVKESATLPAPAPEAEPQTPVEVPAPAPVAAPVAETPLPEVTPVIPVPLPIELVSAPSPEAVAKAVVPARQGRGTRVKQSAKNLEEAAENTDETQHVRMSKELVLQAKMNILRLPRNFGIKNLRDYGDAAFLFYEAHLRKIGKL